jgi:hypothetical protein
VAEGAGVKEKDVQLPVVVCTQTVDILPQSTHD